MLVDVRGGERQLPLLRLRCRPEHLELKLAQGRVRPRSAAAAGDHDVVRAGRRRVRLEAVQVRLLLQPCLRQLLLRELRE